MSTTPAPPKGLSAAGKDLWKALWPTSASRALPNSRFWPNTACAAIGCSRFARRFSRQAYALRVRAVSRDRIRYSARKTTAGEA